MYLCVFQGCLIQIVFHMHFHLKTDLLYGFFYIRYATAILFVINQLTVQRFYVSYFNPCSAVLTVLSQKLQLKRSLGVAIVYLHKEKFILTFCMILDSLISLFDLIGQSSFVFDTVLIETKVNFT